MVTDRDFSKTGQLDFQRLFEAAPGLFLVLLPNAPIFTILGASDAYLRATSTVRAEIVGRPMFEVFPDDPDATGGAQLLASLNRVIATAAPDTMAVQKYHIARPESDGGGFEERYSSQLNSPVLSQDGGIDYILHRVEDVTELVRVSQSGDAQRERSEDLERRGRAMELEILSRSRDLDEANRKLRAPEERYRQLFEQTPDGIFVANPEGRYVDVNPAGCDMLAMTREEVLAKSLTDILDSEQHHRLSSEIARFNGGAILRSEWHMRRKDGSIFDAEMVGRRLPNGNLQGIVRDVTGHRRREQALRESEERFRTLADNINQLAWTCDKLGDVTWYNRRWLDYTGMSFEEMKDWGWKQVHHPDHVDRVVASVTRSRESGEPWEDTFPLRGTDGNYRWFLSRALPIRNAAGEVVRWFGTNTDITEQRKAEETQRMLTGELSHRVKNMLATVQAIASQTFRHNKNPAQFVASFGGRIQSMSRMHSMLSSSEWQGADLRDIIRDQLLLGPVDETRVTARGPAVRLEPQIAPQVAMMLHELGTNSIKYGALSKTDGIVTIGWAVNDDTLLLRWVERGGPPIKAPVKRGFGTALIEQSAKGAGGNAHMSIEADGLQWEISLPLPRPNAARGSSTGSSNLEFVNAAPPLDDAGNAVAASPILAGKRFLVIEDEPLVALEIVASLEQAGADLLGSAGSASEALAAIDRATPDAALLDANLHGQPVGDIAAALTRSNVPFILLPAAVARTYLPHSLKQPYFLSRSANNNWSKQRPPLFRSRRL